jgi:NADH-quinone oxidoreductase subunit A
MLELALAFLVFGALSAIMIVINVVLGPRKPNPARETPFECGSAPLQPGIGPVVFFYPLALAFRGRGLGGFAALGAFLLLLALGFVYVWKKGIFRWT